MLILFVIATVFLLVEASLSPSVQTLTRRVQNHARRRK
jgi:hypothetical protein